MNNPGCRWFAVPSGTRNGHGFSLSPHDGSVANSVTVVPGKRQLAGEGRSLRAERVEILKATAVRGASQGHAS